MVTELRVHGVGGATPEHVLGSGPARLVAGDRDAGFYVADDPRLEAYCWGNLTSGTASRALWLLMLPFTLVNASFWMGPRRRVNEALVRLLALSLTATAVLAAEGVGTDLLAWQCAATSCAGRHTWLHWLQGRDADVRLVVGAAFPLLVLGILWLLSRRTARYEDVRPASGRQEPGLGDPTFWYGARQVARLRQLHVAVGLAVVALGIAHPAGDTVLVALAWALMGAASVAVCVPSVVRRDGPETVGVTWTRWLPVAGFGLVAATVVSAFAGSVPDVKGPLPGYGLAVTAVFLAQLGGVAALAAVAGRCAQAVFAALGLLFASVFTAGLEFRVADWLDGPASPEGGPLTLPTSYEWASVAFLLVAVPAVVGLGLAGFRAYRTARRRAVGEVERDYDTKEPRDRVLVVAKARALASLTDHVVGWVSVVTVFCVLSAFVAMGVTLLRDDGPPPALRPLVVGGTWLVSGVAGGLVLLGLRSYRQASLRKHVGILWDLGTFWPRAAHPMAPPCYAERCVPDLAVRVQHHAPGGVLLSAHSQGTVLAAALVHQLPPDVLSRVRLVTYGSPLARLYGAVYRPWFGDLQPLQDRLGAGHWVNLFRPTDYIGGPVHTAADEPLPRDPEVLTRPHGDPAWPAPRTHFDYEVTEAYREARDRLVSTL